MSAPLQPTLPPHSKVFLAEINAQLKQQLDAATSEPAYARMKIQILEEHLRLRRIAKYGPGSETLSNLQLELLEEEPAVSREEVQAEGQRDALPKPDEKKRPRRAHPGRQTLPADLPRVEKIVACTPGGGVVFDFRMSRARQGPKHFLGAFAGILQTDDYIAYERGLGGPQMVHACCWSHARRHFVDAVSSKKGRRLDSRG